MGGKNWNFDHFATDLVPSGISKKHEWRKLKKKKKKDGKARFTADNDPTITKLPSG